MNKILINNDDIKLLEEDECLEVTLSDKLDFYDIVKMNITVKKDTSLDIDIKGNNEIKLDVSINVLPNVNFKMNNVTETDKIKIQYKHYLSENSNFEINKFYDTKELKELNIVYLNGINSKVDYNFKSISKEVQKLDILIYHNYKDTTSNIENKIVTIQSGEVVLNCTAMVYNGITGCTLNQNNRIISMNNKKNIINPNLLIEEEDVDASHSAHISKFNDELLFYMQTRGINKDQAINLLIQGFLNSETDKIKKIINKYWR